MKTNMLVILILITGLLTFSCASNGYNTQKGAAIGAGLGAIAGQIIGNNTAGTLIGAAGGALAGAIAGNAVDQNNTDQQIAAAQRQNSTYASPAGIENPPGQWVEIPGQWVGGKWVPTHRAWVPINP
ncbi:MAG: glycine zipper domain-containing protein [Proteobacteria bacterium]|nr:glycine zipper domain-containing protein [Pseudomonadota bacterium]